MQKVTYPKYIQVALPVPLRRTFDYVYPETFNHPPMVGARVRVSFGRRELIGIITGTSESSDLPKDMLKPALLLFDQQSILPAQSILLLQWCAQYYQHPLGEVYQAALPAWVRKGKPLPEVLEKENEVRIPTDSSAPAELNEEQVIAIQAVTQQLQHFQPFLLDGITGSGKTEVYIQLTKTVIAKGQQVLILVPEIGLTPQTFQRFEKRFHCPVIKLHSGLTEKKRFIAWAQIKQSGAAIIIGTRSAIFSPFEDLGLIVVDEEHDGSFKQQDGFRYSARDLSVKVAQLWHCPVLLGSATPSLETLHNVTQKRYQYLRLSKRATKSQLPNIEIFDIRHHRLNEGLSAYLIQKIKHHIEKQGQVLLFLNRRGYSPVLLCHACGWHASCRRCDAKMTFHYKQHQLRCHHCDARQNRPSQCPSCQEDSLCTVGIGTERIEQALEQLFPHVTYQRVDRDTTKGASGTAKLIESILLNKPQILIGTQMIAKGHHLPDVTLVAILDIDSALFSGDYRATEKMGQLIIQVAGRAGRGQKKGEVILQTRQPNHPLLQKLVYGDYQAFSRSLAEERSLANLPPYSAHILFRAESKKTEKALNFLNQLKKDIPSNIQKGIQLLGPIPAPMERRKGYFRALLLLQSNNRPQLLQLGRQLTQMIEADKASNRVRWSLDVDPVDMF